MYAKSMIEYFRTHLASGEFQHRLSYMPAAMVLAVAILPFTLGIEHEQLDTNATHAEPVAVAAPSENIFRVSNAAAPPLRVALPEDRRYKAIADFMARKYRVSQDVVHDLVKTAHAVGRQMGVDPLLIVAVMAVESSFNPIAESVAGAKGLMQIIPKYHPEKFAEFGGEQSAFEPRTNILVGARIIREYLSSSSGDLFTALQTYAGALADRDAAYTHRVLNEKDKLDELSGLPKTDRGMRIARIEQQQDAGRVTVTLPASTPAAVPALPQAPAALTPAPAAQPVASQPPAAVTPPKPADEPAA